MQLRIGTEDDLPFVVKVEHLPEFREYIGRWTHAEHVEAIRNPDTRYLIAVDESGNRTGYAILRGIQSEHRNMELRRIAMESPGHGYGRQMLRLVMEEVFRRFGAHRLWLDVFEENHRAQHVYLSLGFRRDGVFREAILRDNTFHSLILMSILDREYRDWDPSLVSDHGI